MSLIPVDDTLTHTKPSNFMIKLGEIMSDEKFRSFFKEYFNDWTDIQTAIMLMKTYAFVDEEYNKSVGHHMTSDEIVNVVQKMVKDTKCRQLLVQEMDGFMQDKQTFLEYYRGLVTYEERSAPESAPKLSYEPKS